MGFGHGVYNVGDPRATHRRASAVELAPESGVGTHAQMSRRIEESVLAEKGLCPSVDSFAATVCYHLGIPGGEYIGQSGQRWVAQAAR